MKSPMTKILCTRASLNRLNKESTQEAKERLHERHCYSDPLSLITWLSLLK